MRRTRSSLQPTALLGLLFLAAACVTVDATLDADGSAKLTVSYPVNVDSEDHEVARTLVHAPDVTIDDITVAPAAEGARGKFTATAKLSTKDVTKLQDVALFKVLGASISHESKADGGGTLRVELKNQGAKTKDDPEFKELSKYKGMLRLHVPGPVLETTATEKDGVIEWIFPVGDWGLGKTLALTVVYGPPSGGEADGAAGAEEAAADS